MSTKLEELKQEVRVKAEQLHQVFEEAGSDRDFTKVKCLGDNLSTTVKVDKVRGLNTELGNLNRRIKDLEEIEGIAQQAQAEYLKDHQPVNPIQHLTDGQRPEREVRSLGRLLVESKEYSQFKGMRNWPTPLALPHYDIRAAVFRTGAGWATPQIRLDRVALTPLRPIAVIDTIPMLPTGTDVIRYMEETTFTNNAVETAESTATTAADLIGEAALALTERTRNVEWLPVFLPVTMQQMEDVEGIEAYTNQRLAYMIRARLDSQVLVGNGTTPNLLGTNNVTGRQTQAKGADPTPDAVFKGFQLIRSDGFAEPSVAFIHPNDWQDIRLLRTADGIYIWGNPSEAGPERLWGVPVVQTVAAAENTITAGDYANFATLFIKRGIDIAVSDSHAHYFTRGMLAVRADMRMAMVHFRPKAFLTVTGV